MKFASWGKGWRMSKEHYEDMMLGVPSKWKHKEYSKTIKVDGLMYDPYWTEETPMGDTQSKGTVYVCGPMRGMPQHNFPLFYQASAMLELWG